MARRKRRKWRTAEEKEKTVRQGRIPGPQSQPASTNPLAGLAEAPPRSQTRGLRQMALRQAQRQHGNAAVVQRLQGRVQRDEIEVGGKKYANRGEVEADFYDMYAPQAILLNAESFSGQPGLREQIPGFMADYNFWTIPVSRWLMAVGRIQALGAQTGLDPSPGKLDAVDRKAFESAAPAVSAAWNEVEAAAEVSTAYREVSAAFHKLRAAQKTLRAAKQELVAKKIHLEKLPEKEAELKKVEDTIESITKVVTVLEKIVATTAAVVATSGTAAITKEVAGIGGVSSLIGGLATAAYAGEINKLNREISSLKAKAGAAEVAAYKAKFDAAGERIEEAQDTMKASVEKMQSAVAQKRAAYTLAGAKMDEKEAGGGPTVKLSGIGHLEGVMMMASAVREAAAFGKLQLEAMNGGGIIGVLQYQNEKGYLVQSIAPNASQKALLQAVGQIYSFASLTQKYLPDHLLWAEDWQKLIAQSQNIATDKSY